MQILNSVFFLGFVWNICCGVFAIGKSIPLTQQQSDRKRFKAIIKMYIIVGPTWFMEVFGWYLAYHTGIGKCQSHKAMIFFNVVNALQGSLLFMVFYFDMERISSMLTTNFLKHFKAEHQNTDETL